MVELQDQYITTLMPARLAEQQEAKALAYALHRQTEKALRAADGIMLLCDIDNMPDTVLDYLGAEWRTPMYKDDLPIDKKRALVKNTLLFFIQMGTPAAVNRMIQIVAGSGYMTEWQDYDGEPHYFRVTAQPTDGDLSAEMRAEIISAINSVKRLSSWLDQIKYIVEAEGKAQGYAATAYTGGHIRNEMPVQGPEFKPPCANLTANAGAARLGEYAKLDVGTARGAEPQPPHRLFTAQAGAKNCGCYAKLNITVAGAEPKPPSRTFEARAGASTAATYTKIEVEVSAT